MDYEDSVPSAPVRYAFDDSDDELDTKTSLEEDTFGMALVEPFPENPLTLIVGVNAGSSCVAVLEGIRIGHIEYKEKPISDIMITEDRIHLSFPTTVNVNNVNKIANLIFNFPGAQIQKVIILDSFVSTEYTSQQWGEDIRPPFLRVLQTSSTTKIPEFQLYEVPNLVKDLSASILAHCEIHNIPCYALFSLQEAYLGKHIITDETYTAYTQGLEKLGIKLSVDKDKLDLVLKKGQVDEHHHRLYV
ncbi:hypothetical protein BJ944DRAFT_262268 [Cunninghamella echinulata]|nr:hypothetical protein BJ944DRAFT_262268 [Cunninghamella echinulata]